MPVCSVNGLNRAASSAAVQLPPQVLTVIVRVWAMVRSVMIRGLARAAAAPLINARRPRSTSRGVVLVRSWRLAFTVDAAVFVILRSLAGAARGRLHHTASRHRGSTMNTVVLVR